MLRSPFQFRQQAEGSQGNPGRHTLDPTWKPAQRDPPVCTPSLLCLEHFVVWESGYFDCWYQYLILHHWAAPQATTRGDHTRRPKRPKRPQATTRDGPSTQHHRRRHHVQSVVTWGHHLGPPSQPPALDARGLGVSVCWASALAARLPSPCPRACHGYRLGCQTCEASFSSPPRRKCRKWLRRSASTLQNLGNSTTGSW